MSFSLVIAVVTAVAGETRTVPVDARDDYFINRDNYRLFCNSNESLLKEKPRGVVIEFPGLGGCSCLGGR